MHDVPSGLPGTLRGLTRNLRWGEWQQRPWGEEHHVCRFHVPRAVVEIVLDLILVDIGAVLYLDPDQPVLKTGRRTGTELQREIDVLVTLRSNLSLDRNPVQA